LFLCEKLRVDVSKAKPQEEVEMAIVKELVCGMEIDPKSAAATEEYKGETYYFCSNACHKKFKAKPDYYYASA
jgi:Cu+-exporting ATPase